MKKIFLFFSAMLVSLAMQATVVTKSVDWTFKVDEVESNTFTVNAWSSVSKWDWMAGADEYDQLVIEVADHEANLIVTGYFTTDGESRIASAGIMRAGTNSIAVDVTNPILQAIEVTNWSANDEEISVTNMYLRKAIGPKKTVTLWEGSMYFDTFKEWGQEIILENDAFADAHIGDILEIDYTLDETGYYQMSVQTSYNHYRPSFLGKLDDYNNYIIEKQANPNKLSFAIMNETDLTKLQTDGGLRINGALFTVTAVKLIKHDVLWTGMASLDNDWKGGQAIPWSKLTNLKVGNILCVRVTAGEYEEDKYNQVLCTYKSDWSGTFSPAVNYLFQEGDAMPKIVQIPVTSKMLYQLKGEQLNIGGRNFTMTDIYIEEGTPVNTVSAFLNVTEAGMATYVLPFNVPSLPDGVKAYNLTNNGDPTIWAEEVTSLTADQPVLILAAEGEYEFVSEEGASDDISEKTGTYANGALIGTYTAIAELEQKTGGNFNYVLNNQGGKVAFYQVRDNSCSVPAYRAYLSCGHNANQGGANAAPMHIVFRQDNTTAIEDVQGDKVQSTKILRNGQLFILRNGVEYNVNGQMTK